MTPPAWMDHRQTALHPCSLETIPEPVQLANGTQVWPLMVSCYQLEPDGTRIGQMDLHLVEVPDIARSSQSSLPLQLGTPHPIISPTVGRSQPQSTVTSGILDGKWSALPSTTLPESKQSWCFASAHAGGTIHMHALSVFPENHSSFRLPSEPLYQTHYLGGSEDCGYSHKGTAPCPSSSPPPLCLSLNWNSPAPYRLDSVHLTNNTSQLVSTYSNGCIAIHDVTFLSDSVQLILRDSWQAHTVFTTPTEVWTACFMPNPHGGGTATATTTANFSCSNTLVSSGGDDGHLKLWDTRCTTRPVQVLQPPLEAGITCVTPCPADEFLLAVGCYDEVLRLYDIRYMNGRKHLLQTKSLGGGIWRIKWHPYVPHRLLLGIMHGGCRILNLSTTTPTTDTTTRNTSTLHYGMPTTSRPAWQSKMTKKFTKHESMTYGADWLVCPHPTQEGFFEAAGSCSFYDRAVYLWDSVF